VKTVAVTANATNAARANRRPAPTAKRANIAQVAATKPKRAPKVVPTANATNAARANRQPVPLRRRSNIARTELIKQRLARDHVRAANVRRPNAVLAMQQRAAALTRVNIVLRLASMRPKPALMVAPAARAKNAALQQQQPAPIAKRANTARTELTKPKRAPMAAKVVLAKRLLRRPSAAPAQLLRSRPFVPTALIIIAAVRRTKS